MGGASERVDAALADSLLDFIARAARAAVAGVGRTAAREAAALFGEKPAVVTIIGGERRLPCLAGAMVNAVQAGLAGETEAATTAILSAALAQAEVSDVDGGVFLDALALGHAAACRSGGSAVHGVIAVISHIRRLAPEAAIAILIDPPSSASYVSEAFAHVYLAGVIASRPGHRDAVRPEPPRGSTAVLRFATRVAPLYGLRHAEMLERRIAALREEPSMARLARELGACPPYVRGTLMESIGPHF